MDRTVTTQDVHGIVSILMEDPVIVSDKERLYLGLGLPYSLLQDLHTKMFIRGTGSDGFLRDILHAWILKEGINAKFQNLVDVLNTESFISTAEKLVTAFESGSYKNLLNSHSKFFWFDVPQRTSNFTGRVLELQNLHEAIIKQSTEATVITTLSGLGGIGKTTLSIEYAWMFYKSYYTNVIWVNSQTKAALNDSFNRLADKLTIDILDTRGCLIHLDKLAIQIYERFLNENTLIIFDNVEAYDGIKHFLPQCSPDTKKPFVLLTSRNRARNDNITMILLNVFSEDESVGYLKDYLLLESETEMKYAKKISQLLQNLPLAIRQAGAYIKVQQKIHCRSTENQMIEYVNRWNKNFESVLNYEYWSQTGDLYEKTVFLTWNVTLDKIRAKNKVCLRIMQVVAYLNPDNIPIQLFYHLDRKDTIMDKFKSIFISNTLEESDVNDAIELLYSYSIIDKNRDLFNVHRLVQKVVQVYTGSSRLRKTVKLLELCLLSDNSSHFLVHAQSVIAFCRSSDLAWRYYSNLLKLISTRQENLIGEQLNKLETLLQSNADRAVFELFFNFETKLTVGIVRYYSGFLSAILGEINSQSNAGVTNIPFILKLEADVQPVFKKFSDLILIDPSNDSFNSNLTNAEFDSYLSILLWYIQVVILPNVKSYLSMELLNCLNVISNQSFRIYYMTVTKHAAILMKCLLLFGKMVELLELAKRINTVLENTPATSSVVRNSVWKTNFIGVANFIVENVGNPELIPWKSEFLEQTHAMLRKVYVLKVEINDELGISVILRGLLMISIELDKIPDILKYVARIGVLVDVIQYRQELLKLAEVLFQISIIPKCETIKAILLEVSIFIYFKVKYNTKSFRVDYELYTRTHVHKIALADEGIMKCLAELTSVDELEEIINRLNSVRAKYQIRSIDSRHFGNSLIELKDHIMLENESTEGNLLQLKQNLLNANLNLMEKFEKERNIRNINIIRKFFTINQNVI